VMQKYLVRRIYLVIW